MLSMLAPKVFNKKNLFLYSLKLNKNSTKEAADLSLRPPWSTNRVTGQPGLLQKTLSWGWGEERAYIVLRVYSIFQEMNWTG